MPRADMNTVRLAVRQVALDGKQFTVFDVQRRTGLNIESIRTEIQRLRQDGFIETISPVDGPSDSDRPRGAPAATYCLTDDRAKVRSLRQTVAAFYFGLPIERPPEPTSQHFFDATKAIDEAMMCSDPAQKNAILEKADFELEAASLVEGDEGATDTLKAHLMFESARLKLAQGGYLQARNEFAKSSKVFLKHRDYKNVRVANDHVIACDLELIAESHETLIRQKQKVIRILNEQVGNIASPLSRAILDTVQFTEVVEEDEGSVYVGGKVPGRDFPTLIGHELETCEAAL